MSNKGSKVPHLALVPDRDGVARDHVKQVPPEALTSVQRDLIDEILHAAKAQGTIVGALVGKSSRDIRPMLLARGALTVIRCSSDTISYDSEKLELLEHTYGLLPEFKNGIIRFGRTKNYLWVQRPYYKRILFHEHKEILDTDLIAQIVEAVESLHAIGGVHGHISPANIALSDEGTLYLIDHGFSSLALPQERDRYVAPELIRGELPQMSSDVYALGVCIEQMIDAELSSKLRPILLRMTSAVPHVRPTLAQVSQQLFQLLGVSPHHGEHSPQGRVLENSISLKGASKTSQKLGVPTPHPQDQDLERATVSANTLPPSSMPLMKMLASATATGLIVGAAYWYAAKPREATLPLATYWSSNQLSLMQLVAEQALTFPFGEAASHIVNDALQKTVHPSIRTNLIRMSFHPLWGDSLTHAERTLVFSVSLIGVLPQREGRLIIPQQLRAPLVLAIASDIPERILDKELAQFPVTHLISLPPPFGPAFALLAGSGVATMNELPARGLAHLARGDLSPRALAMLFSGIPREGVTQAQVRVRAVRELLGEYPELDKVLSEFLSQDGVPALTLGLRWLKEDPAGVWKGSDGSVKTMLFSGLLPTQISFEQYVDLLSYPGVSLRIEAAKELAKMLPNDITELLQLFIKGEHSLSRGQLIILMSSLRFPGEKGYGFMSGWIQLEPDPLSVAKILAACKSCNGIEALTLEGGRYLKSREWKGGIDLMRRLTEHQDSFIRSIAYAKLDPSNAYEALLLRDAAAREEKPGLRSLLLQKLAKLHAVEEN